MQEGPIISIQLATIRPKNIIAFLDNFNETALDPYSFEVLIKIDEGDDDLKNILENYRNKVSFNYRYFVLPKLKKYFSLHKGYDFILQHAAPSTKLACIFTDELRIKTSGWDEKIKKYLNHYEDGIHRLKPTKKRARNYYNYDECINLGDSYCYFSSAWLNLTGGWGEFWAPDTWHQCLDYHLGLCKQGTEAVFRSMPIFDLEMGGIDPSVGVNGEFESYKVWMNINGCHILESHLGRENFFRLAHRLYGHIIMHSMGVENYVIDENYKHKIISVYSDANPSLKYEASFALLKNNEDRIKQSQVIAATSKEVWNDAIQEVSQRPNLKMKYQSKKPGILPSGSQHIELLMDALKQK